MATGIRGSSDIIKNMSYNPIRQLELANAERARKADNRAIGASDQMLGKQVASEQSRLMELDQFGEQMAMRKDKLAFAKKIQAEKTKMAKEKLAFAKSQSSKEFTLGLASTAAGTLNMLANRNRDELWKDETRQYRINMYKRIGANYKDSDPETYQSILEEINSLEDNEPKTKWDKIKRLF